MSEMLTPKKNAINHGTMLGLMLGLSTTLMYALNAELFLKWWVGILSLLLVIAMGIISTAKSKGLLGGFMTFKEAFTAYFITTAVGLAISTAVGILIFTVIDPELASYLNEQSLLMVQDMMARFGAPQEEIDKAIAEAAQVDNFSIMSQAKSYFSLLIFHSVLGLLIGLIFKKAAPTV
ncbi:MAG: DUF4199 domain-containing protein [Flavobacteriaceae bacterium]|nr:DUF4199 domain-containing protein [Flavobacteriaceae bacterium]MDG1961809.1 DUF4199 domain-containing protein [Flavobacteriaceae bacterium]